MGRRYPATFEQLMATQLSLNFLVTHAHTGVADTGAVTCMIGLQQLASYCENVLFPRGF